MLCVNKYIIKTYLDLAFDSLGDDEFQCLLFIMPKPVRVMIVFYWCIHSNIFIRHVRWSSLGVLDPGVPSPALAALSRPGALAAPYLSAPGAGSAHAPSSLQLAEAGRTASDYRTCSVSWGPLRTAASTSPPGPATLRAMAAAARHPRQRQRRRRRQPRPPQTLA